MIMYTGLCFSMFKPGLNFVAECEMYFVKFGSFHADFFPFHKLLQPQAVDDSLTSGYFPQIHKSAVVKTPAEKAYP